MKCNSNQESVIKECVKCIVKCNPNQERNLTTGRCKLKKIKEKQEKQENKTLRKDQLHQF